MTKAGLFQYDDLFNIYGFEDKYSNKKSDA